MCLFFITTERTLNEVPKIKWELPHSIVQLYYYTLSLSHTQTRSRFIKPTAGSWPLASRQEVALSQSDASVKSTETGSYSTFSVPPLRFNLVMAGGGEAQQVMWRNSGENQRRRESDFKLELQS